jgi:hypothetical protein
MSAGAQQPGVQNRTKLTRVLLFATKPNGKLEPATEAEFVGPAWRVM